MKAAKGSSIDTHGLSACGIWVRRLRNVPSLTDEALSLAQVMQTWNLSRAMAIDHYSGMCAEISRLDLQPTWVYLVELVGTRLHGLPLVPNHPLGQVPPNRAVRIVALVQPVGMLILGALVETEDRRRMIWLQENPVW